MKKAFGKQPRVTSGSLEDDLLPNWYVLDGSPCQWRLVAIIEPTTKTLGLVRELWKSPVRGAPPRWGTAPEQAMFLGNPQTQALRALLAQHLGGRGNPPKR